MKFLFEDLSDDQRALVTAKLATSRAACRLLQHDAEDAQEAAWEQMDEHRATDMVTYRTPASDAAWQASERIERVYQDMVTYRTLADELAVLMLEP